MYDLVSSSIEGRVKLTCFDVTENDGMTMRVDGMVWTRERTIMVSAEVVPDGDRLVTMLCLSWTGDIGGNGEVAFTLQELYPSDVSRECTADRQMLVGACVREWDRAAVLAHQGIFDGHIRPFVSVDGAVAFENITEDKLCLRLPNAPDDGDNCIRSVGLDCTTGPPCPHPLDDQADDLRGFPRAWILTSDGVLRAYILASVSGRPPPCVDPRPVPVVVGSVIDQKDQMNLATPCRQRHRSVY